MTLHFISRMRPRDFVSALKMLLTVLYGSQTGVGEELAHFIGSFALANGVDRCNVAAIDDTPIDTWCALSPLVLVCSTTGQGDAPINMRNSWDALRALDAVSMQGCMYAVFGLGDSSYAKYNYIAKMLHNRLLQLGGVPLIHRGLGDDQDAFGPLESLLPWMLQLWSAIGLTVAIPPTECPVAAKFSVHRDGSEKMCTTSFPRRPNTRLLTVRQNTRITSSDHFQDVHHIEFERPVDFDFAPGESVAVFPENRRDVAESLLARCHVSPTTVVHISASESGLNWIAPICDVRMLAVDFLMSHYDLDACATRLFLQSMILYDSDDEERERLAELTKAEGYDDFLGYCYKERRTCLEVLQDFPHCTLPLSMLLSCMRQLKPRFFSISSSPSRDVATLSITVARVKFTTPYRRERQGICSSYLCDACPSSTVECLASPVAFSWIPLEDVSKTLILVGPGTGIAPIRSVVREIAHVWQGCIHIFCGCRHPEKDYLYGEEWSALAATNSHVKVHAAFSRYENKKTYVQHVIRTPEVAMLLRGSLSNAVIFVCGNSKRMPQDVEAALLAVMRDVVCDGDDALAQSWLKQKKHEGEYVTDTWS